MKKKSILRILVGTLCLSMMLSVAAFASTTPSTPALDKNAMDTATKLEEAKHTSAYIQGGGVVEEISADKDSYRILVSNDQGGMFFATTENVLVVDQKSGKIISVKDLKAGMELVAVYPANSPMGLSLPPHCGSAVAFIVKNDASSVNISVFNDELINANNTLKLNISEDTQIIDIKGAKIQYTAEDLKKRDCIVLYTTSTRSIPAQTNPEMVILLDKEEISTDATEKSTDSTGVEEQAVEDQYTELRAGAEAKGYKVEWTSSKKPIVLTKGDMTVELTVGSKEFTFTHMTRDLKELDRMETLSLSVMLENGKTMVPTSFMNALQ